MALFNLNPLNNLTAAPFGGNVRITQRTSGGCCRNDSIFNYTMPSNTTSIEIKNGPSGFWGGALGFLNGLSGNGFGMFGGMSNMFGGFGMPGMFGGFGMGNMFGGMSNLFGGFGMGNMFGGYGMSGMFGGLSNLFGLGSSSLGGTSQADAEAKVKVQQQFNSLKELGGSEWKVTNDGGPFSALLRGEYTEEGQNILITGDYETIRNKIAETKIKAKTQTTQTTQTTQSNGTTSTGNNTTTQA